MPGRLAGARVLVLRPRARSEALCFLLEDEGAEVVPLPLLEVQPPDDLRPLHAAAEQLHRYRWVLFASPAAVDAWVDAVRQAGTEGSWHLVKLGAVGPATAAALRGVGLPVQVQAESSSGEGLFEAVKQSLEPGDQVLLPAAQEGRRELLDALTAHGIAVTRVAAYKSGVAQAAPGEVSAAFEPLPSAAVFGSPRTVQAFLGLGGEGPRRVLAEGAAIAIGPTTAAALREHGAQRVVEASAPTAEALVDAVVAALRPS